MSKLLFNKRPLVIDPELACLIGLHESIILQQIHYWVEINRKADKNFKNGFYWTYNSYDDWQKQFPFWNSDTVRRGINRLESKGYLVSGNFNKMKMDRTKWYRIDYKCLEELTKFPIVQNAQMQVDSLHSTIPEINQRVFKPEHELELMTVISESVKKRNGKKKKGKLLIKTDRLKVNPWA